MSLIKYSLKCLNIPELPELIRENINKIAVNNNFITFMLRSSYYSYQCKIFTSKFEYIRTIDLSYDYNFINNSLYEDKLYYIDNKSLMVYDINQDTTKCCLSSDIINTLIQLSVTKNIIYMIDQHIGYLDSYIIKKNKNDIYDDKDISTYRHTDVLQTGINYSSTNMFPLVEEDKLIIVDIFNTEEDNFIARYKYSTIDIYNKIQKSDLYTVDELDKKTRPSDYSMNVNNMSEYINIFRRFKYNNASLPNMTIRNVDTGCIKSRLFNICARKFCPINENEILYLDNKHNLMMLEMK